MKRFITYLSVLIFTFCLIPGCTYATGVGHSGVSGTATTIPGDFNIKGVTTLGIKGASGGTAPADSKLVLDSTGNQSITLMSSSGTSSQAINFGDNTSPDRTKVIYYRNSNLLTLVLSAAPQFTIGTSGLYTDSLSAMGAGSINSTGSYINGVNNQAYRAIFSTTSGTTAPLYEYPTGWATYNAASSGQMTITASGFTNVPVCTSTITGVNTFTYGGYTSAVRVSSGTPSNIVALSYDPTATLAASIISIVCFD